MIILSNGDKWVLGDSEWKGAGISYEDATACKLPMMPIREFIEKLLDDGYLLPRKWTNAFIGGYWDANFDVYEEVFTDAASQIISNNWSEVYIMPWGHVYVVYQAIDSDRCDPYTGVTKLEDIREYIKAVIPLD